MSAGLSRHVAAKATLARKRTCYGRCSRLGHGVTKHEAAVHAWATVARSWALTPCSCTRRARPPPQALAGLTQGCHATSLPWHWSALTNAMAKTWQRTFGHAPRGWVREVGGYYWAGASRRVLRTLPGRLLRATRVPRGGGQGPHSSPPHEPSGGGQEAAGSLP